MTVAAALAMLGVIPTLLVLYRPLRADSDRRALGITVACAGVSAALWVAVSAVLPGVLGSPMWLPTVAFAAVAGVLVALPLRTDPVSGRAVVVFCAAWTTLVFVPVVTVVVFPAAVGLDPASSPLDLGGVLPVHVTVGASALAVALLRRRRPVQLGERASTTAVILAAAALWALYALVLVSLELAFDDVTPVILTNVVAAPVAAAVAWLAVERARRHRNTLGGAVAGLVCGLVAVSAGSGFLEPLWAILTGVIAGLVPASILLHDPHRARLTLVVLHLVPAALGLVLLGLFGTGSGFIYTGQPTAAIAQLSATVVIALWSLAVSAALTVVARILPRTRRSRRAII
jgi:ammonia channel protein AmtB